MRENGRDREREIMKLAWAFLWPLIKIVGGYSVLLVTGYITIDAWVITKAETVVNPVRKEMMAVRNADFEHMNARFDRAERKLDKIIRIMGEK